MADIFSKTAALDVLKNKFVLLIGDSNIRALYNDLIYLLHNNDVVPPMVLRKHSNKGVGTSLDLDKVVRKGQVTDATRHIQEVREYNGQNGVRVRFCFITRVLGDQMVRELDEMEQGDGPLPDIVLLHSCLWDITRWGAMQEAPYKRYMAQAFLRLRTLLPAEALLLWATAMPVALSQVKGGYLIKQLEFVQCNVRFMAMEANLYAAELCKLFGFDLLDFHYHMRFQLARRSSDGIHWEPHAMRHLTCILLTHIALSFDHPLPGVLASDYLSTAVEAAKEQSDPDYLAEVRLGLSMVSSVLQELEAVSEGRHLPHEDITDQERRKKRGRRFNSGNTLPSHSQSGCAEGEQSNRLSAFARLSRCEHTKIGELERPGSRSPDVPPQKQLLAKDIDLYTRKKPSQSPVQTNGEPSVDSNRLDPLPFNKVSECGAKRSGNGLQEADLLRSDSTESVNSRPLASSKKSESTENVSDHSESSSATMNKQASRLLNAKPNPHTISKQKFAKRNFNASTSCHIKNSRKRSVLNSPASRFSYGSDRNRNPQTNNNNITNWIGDHQPNAPQPFIANSAPFNYRNREQVQEHSWPPHMRPGSGPRNACNPFNNPPGFIGHGHGQEAQVHNIQQFFGGHQATQSMFDNSQRPWWGQPPQPFSSRLAYPNTDYPRKNSNYYASGR